MTRAETKPTLARKRIAALEWEATCEQLRCALGVLPRPCEEPPADLMASIRRARELLAELERLHEVASDTTQVPDDCLSAGLVPVAANGGGYG